MKILAAIGNQDNIGDLLSVQEQWDPIWENMLSGGFTVFSALCNLGLLFAAIGLMVWAVKTFRAFAQGDDYSGWSGFIFPLVVVLFLANSGHLLKEFILFQRSILDTVNQEVLSSLNVNYKFSTVLSGSGDLQYIDAPQSSLLVNSTEIADSEKKVKVLIQSLKSAVDNCGRIIGPNKVECFDRIFADDSDYSPNSQKVRSLGLVPTHYAFYINRYISLKRGVEDIKRKIEAAKNPGLFSNSVEVAEGESLLGSVPNLSSNIPNAQPQQEGFNLGGFIGDALMGIFDFFLTLFQVVFAHVGQLALLLMSLLAPVAFGTSLINPQGGLSGIFGWLVGFWSVGIAMVFLTICQGVCQLLTAVDTGSPLTNLPFFAIGLVGSIISPVVAFALASGGGLAIYTSFVQGGIVGYRITRVAAPYVAKGVAKAAPYVSRGVSRAGSFVVNRTVSLYNSIRRR